jgi:hypothetical protein
MRLHRLRNTTGRENSLQPAACSGQPDKKLTTENTEGTENSR